MNAALLPSRACLLGLTLLAPAFACDSSPKTDPKGDAKPTADAKVDGKKTDAKADANKADAKPDAKPVDDAKADDTKAATPAKRPPKQGAVPPEGMTADEIKKFAADAGDPSGGEITLAQAFEGDPALADPAGGTLIASFDTTMGAFECELYEKEAPLTVANFVGLARGKRAAYDKKTDSWVAKPYFDGNIFHRVIKGFMIQTGDATNSGRGNPGFVIVDELSKKLRHDSAGVLSMANREKPNTGSTQFFITVKATPHLDGKHAVFGKCADAKVPIAISEVKVDARAGDRPYEQVKINSVTISRKPGKPGKKGG